MNHPINVQEELLCVYSSILFILIWVVVYNIIQRYLKEENVILF